ncbi:MAG TPA: adenylyltransferase/cytidyltransferase family protein [Acidimicrobiales bacterium]
MEVGLYAGSFDPVHLGHMALIATASEKLDQIVVVVATNPEKRTAMFSVPERLEMLWAACQDLANVRVAAHSGVADRHRRPGWGHCVGEKRGQRTRG